MMAAKTAKKEEPKSEKRLPDFIVRCKQGPDSDFWLTAGAAWQATFKDGSKGYSVKLNNLPTNWNGDCLLMKPKEQD